MGNNIKIARYSLHMWEEPIISGKNGSGTIFFSGCNLGCIYCQNYQIAHENFGKEVSLEDFVNICLKLQDAKAYNINLVTGTHFIPLIRDGLLLAKEKGLKKPIVYNTSSYENIEALKMLDGLIDIYLPDLKYYDDSLGEKYSKCKNYFEYASKAIEEMIKQNPKVVIKNGIMQKGVIVRHLMLPGHLEDSKKIIKYLSQFKDKIYISIMNQYTPVKKLEYDNLNNKINDSDYDELVNYAYDLGIRNAFIQEGDTVKESFIPDFNIFEDLKRP
jgi:putative pyruvate formate lyase activating enzyme